MEDMEDTEGMEDTEDMVATGDTMEAITMEDIGVEVDTITTISEASGDTTTITIITLEEEGYGYGGYGGYGGLGGVGLLGALMGFRQPYYGYSSYYQPSYYQSYYQPSYYQYSQPYYRGGGGAGCETQQYVGMYGPQQHWYCVCNGAASYQYGGCSSPYGYRKS
ncbi:unnamed protein product [Nippostrongylus brasiliensis]|uniref:Shematrin-like protein 1 n=1 Tax=Nippostrongylus brasiliensis TaxID=27835 RepID=A0A0N4YY34_NIPBR|nr:unnamed protein product [Nippostrongylus brasiliensis]